MTPNWIQTHTAMLLEGGDTSLTCPSVDIGSGSDRTLVAIITLQVFENPACTCTNVTFGGTSLTYRIRVTHNWGGTVNETVEIWTLDNPSNTTADVVATFSKSSPGGSLTVLEYTGANNGIGANTGISSGSGDPFSVSFVTGSNTNLIIGGFCIGDPYASVTPGSGVTERSELQGGDTYTNGTGWTCQKNASGGSDTIDGTGPDANWAGAAIELKGPDAAIGSYVILPSIRRLNHLVVR